MVIPELATGPRGRVLVLVEQVAPGHIRHTAVMPLEVQTAVRERVWRDVENAHDGGDVEGQRAVTAAEWHGKGVRG